MGLNLVGLRSWRSANQQPAAAVHFAELQASWTSSVCQGPDRAEYFRSSARSCSMTEGTSLGSRAVAVLLTSCKHMGLESAVALRALSLFADIWLPAVGAYPLMTGAATQIGPADGHQVFLAAVSCILLTLRHACGQLAGEAGIGQKDPQLTAVFTAAEEVLGPDFEAFSSRDLATAAAEVAGVVGLPATLAERERDTVSFVELFISQIQQAGLKAFSGIDTEICFNILELLYADGGAQFRGAIWRGGKLMAASTIVAAFALAAPSAMAGTQVFLPSLAWLAELAQFPKDVIASQAAAIVQHVVGCSTGPVMARV